ncbi:MAG: hypothetical protein AAF213_10990, partial [Pseudomonadota bacterium]
EGVDDGADLSRLEQQHRLWQRAHDGAHAFKADIARLHEPLDRVSEQLIAKGKEPVTAANFKAYYGGIINPLKTAVDPDYWAVRKAMGLVGRNMFRARNRQVPFADIRFDVHPHRPNSVPRIRADLAANLDGLEAADRLVAKADDKMARLSQPLRLARMREQIQGVDQVDDQVIAQGIERFQDPLALEALAVKTQDPVLSAAVLHHVKAVALDNLSRTMFDHTRNARDDLFLESDTGPRRGQVRTFRTVSERNRYLIGYQVHDYLLTINAEHIRKALAAIEQPAGPTIAKNKAMIVQALATDKRLEPMLTAKQLDQFEFPDATGQEPIPAELVAGLASDMGYGLDDEQMRVVIADHTEASLPERPKHLAADQPLPRPRRFGG